MNAINTGTTFGYKPEFFEEIRQQREKRFEEQAIADAKTYRVPNKGRDQIEYVWATDCLVGIICHLDYSPAEGDNWNTPHYDESVELCAAYLRGVDIFEMLSHDQIAEIEEKALIGHAQDAREAASEARWDRRQEWSQS